MRSSMRSHMNAFNMNTQNTTPPQPPPRRRAYSVGQTLQSVQSNQAYPRRSLFDTTTNYVSIFCFVLFCFLCKMHTIFPLF